MDQRAPCGVSDARRRKSEANRTNQPTGDFRETGTPADRKDPTPPGVCTDDAGLRPWVISTMPPWSGCSTNLGSGAFLSRAPAQRRRAPYPVLRTRVFARRPARGCRAPSFGHWPALARRRASRPGRAAPRRMGDRANRGLCCARGTLPPRAAPAADVSSGSVDQSTQERAR
jgi:hypothetical protein